MRARKLALKSSRSYDPGLDDQYKMTNMYDSLITIIS